MTPLFGSVPGVSRAGTPADAAGSGDDAAVMSSPALGRGHCNELGSHVYAPAYALPRAITRQRPLQPRNDFASQSQIYSIKRGDFSQLVFCLKTPPSCERVACTICRAPPSRRKGVRHLLLSDDQSLVARQRAPEGGTAPQRGGIRTIHAWRTFCNMHATGCRPPLVGSPDLQLRLPPPLYASRLGLPAIRPARRYRLGCTVRDDDVFVAAHPVGKTQGSMWFADRSTNACCS